MINRINQLMTLADGKKYAVVKQAIYKNENYYAVVRVNEDEQSINEEYAILHELMYNDQMCIEKVEDPEMIKFISKYLGLDEK
ncbi:MAG: hypothetical protein RSB71_00450 [Bacilli bacterium]